jgi:ketosteroid isomerase-like protein
MYAGLDEDNDAQRGGEGRSMRRILLMGLTLAVSLAACGSGQSTASRLALEKQADTYAIEQIEVNWHKASSTKNLDLMMSLWAGDATATLGGQTYTGKAQIRNFFATKAAPFQPQNHWVSDTPAYKRRVTVDGDKGTLYFECDYIDVATREVKAVVSADQDVARINGRWLITNAISATPELSP